MRKKNLKWSIVEVEGIQVMWNDRVVIIKEKYEGYEMRFDSKTVEYGIIMYILGHDDDYKALRTLVLFLISTKLIVSSVSFRDEYNGILKKYVMSVDEPEVENDAEILAEEKVLHEGSVESINELEEIKKGRNDEQGVL